MADDLLAASAIGQKWHDDYIQECQEDPARFEKPIKRRKVKNFAHDALKMKVKTKEKCGSSLYKRLVRANAIPSSITRYGLGQSVVLSFDDCSIVTLTCEWINEQNRQISLDEETGKEADTAAPDRDYGNGNLAAAPASGNAGVRNVHSDGRCDPESVDSPVPDGLAAKSL